MKINQRKLTDDQKQFIIDNYKKYYVKDLTVMFNKKFGSNIKEYTIHNFKQKHNLKHSFKYDIGNYSKTHKHNRTQKQINASVKNILNYNYGRRQPIGYITNGNSRGYKVIKVNDNIDNKNNFILRSIYNYEKINGKLPKNYVLIHLDGNCQNDNIDNLKAVPIYYRQFINSRQLLTKDKDVNNTIIMSVDLMFKALDKKKKGCIEKLV